MADSLPILVLMAIMFRLGSTLPIEPEKGKAYDHLLTTTPVPEKDLWWQRLLEEPCAYIQENWADSDTLDPHHKILPREAKEDHHKPDFHYKKIIKVLNKTAQSVGKLLEHYTVRSNLRVIHNCQHSLIRQSPKYMDQLFGVMQL